MAGSIRRREALTDARDGFDYFGLMGAPYLTQARPRRRRLAALLLTVLTSSGTLGASALAATNQGCDREEHRHEASSHAEHEDGSELFGASAPAPGDALAASSECPHCPRGDCTSDPSCAPPDGDAASPAARIPDPGPSPSDQVARSSELLASSSHAPGHPPPKPIA